MHRIERDLDLENARLELLGPAYDPGPSKLAGEGVIQPTGGAVELAFDLPSELSYGQSVTEGSYRWLLDQGKVQVAALVRPAAV